MSDINLNLTEMKARATDAKALAADDIGWHWAPCRSSTLTALACDVEALAAEVERLRADVKTPLLTTNDEMQRTYLTKDELIESHAEYIVKLETELEQLRAVLEEINAWCGTDAAASALPSEPPWYENLRKALGMVES